MDDRQQDTEQLVFRPIASAVVIAIATGFARELAAFGARGDGKTFAVLGGMIAHAKIHASTCQTCLRLLRSEEIAPYLALLLPHGWREHPVEPDAECDRFRGFPLPVPWLAVMDYHTSHKDKTIKSMQKPVWRGGWRFKDDHKTALYVVRGRRLLDVSLVGVEDRGAIDKVRRETCNVWFDEAAPADVLVTSAGISETAWGMAITSQRVPTHKKVAVLTENYPDEDHWTWQRFVVKQEPGTAYFRIPVGERATSADRDEWATALRSRPDLHRRLIAGMPGGIQLGEPVTPSYTETDNWSPVQQPFADGPLYIGLDYWHHPACVIATLTPMGQLRFHFGRRLDNSDVGALIEDLVIPWLGANNLMDRPRILTGDPTGETGDQSDKAMNAVRRVLKLLPGQYRKVSNSEEQRAGPLNEQLRRKLSTGGPVILVCGKEAYELHRALAGGWHKRKSGKFVTEGEAGKHSHVGNACGYVCLAIFGQYTVDENIDTWVNQEAYTQPWNGAPAGARSPSPAGAVLARGTFDREKWAKQYRR